jgi:hypothetical protein
MDRSMKLNTLFQFLSRNLLSPSSDFEPMIPKSDQNTSYALSLLGSLSKLTQDNLQALEKKMEKAAEVQSTSKPTAPGSSQPAQKTAAPSPNKHGIDLNNQEVLRALLELRKSQQASRKQNHNSSPILKK